MDPLSLVLTVHSKTQQHRLDWEVGSEPYELKAFFGTHPFVLRMRNLLNPELTLENTKSQVIMRVSAEEDPLGLLGTSLHELWKMIEIDGKSADEAADEALQVLNDL